jgi:lysophospholipase L1-like esterase
MGVLSAAEIAAAGGDPTARVQRLLRGPTPNTVVRSVLASSPTYSEATGNSTIVTTSTTGVTGGRFRPNDTARVTGIGAPIILDPFNANRYRQQTRMYALATGQRISGHAGGVRFATFAPSFDIALNVGNTGFQVALYVTDPATGIRARAQVNDYDIALTGMVYRKWDFGTPGYRIIELYFRPQDLISIGCLNVAAAYDIWSVPEAADQPRIGFLGDSWFDNGGPPGNGATNVTRQLSIDYFAERFGCANPIGLSVGATGLLRDASPGVAGTFRARIAAGDADASRIGDLDMLFIPGSVNDTAGSFTDAQVQAEYALTIAAARAAQPKAIILGMGSQNTPAYPITQSRFDAHRDGFAAGAGGEKRMIYLDNSPAGYNVLSTAINTYTQGTDGFHLNDTGNPYYGKTLAEIALTAMRARYAA